MEKSYYRVKSGNDEQFIENFLESDEQIYFSHFIISEIEDYLKNEGFKVIFIEERAPYSDEINVQKNFCYW